MGALGFCATFRSHRCDVGSFGLAFCLCMVFARSAGMAFNRWADAELDARNPRTKKMRAIPAGQLTRSFAGGFTIVTSLLFPIAASQLNRRSWLWREPCRDHPGLQHTGPERRWRRSKRRVRRRCGSLSSPWRLVSPKDEAKLNANVGTTGW